ncbi:MAG: PKD domain-containing protein [Thermoplasmatota archaeon]
MVHVRSLAIFIPLAAAGVLLCLLAPAGAWGFPNTSSFGVTTAHPAGIDGGKYAYVTGCDAPACRDPGIAGGAGADPGAPSGAGPFPLGDAFVGRPTYNWIELSGTATAKLSPDADFYGTAGSVTLPFTFTYYGKKETTYTVCQQGALYFPDPTNARCSYSSYGFSEAFNFANGFPTSYILAPQWAPLYLDPSNSAAGIFHSTVGSGGSRIDVVEWTHMQYCAQSAIPDPTGYSYYGYYVAGAAGQSNPGVCRTHAGDMTFEVQIFESDNHVEFHYQHMSTGGISTTVNAAGTPATQIGINGETGWGGTHGLSYWFGGMWAPTGAQGNAFQTGASEACYGYAAYYSCPTFSEPDGFVIGFYKESPPTGAPITATVNEGVPTLLQLQGTSPSGRPLLASLRAATPHLGAGGTGPTLAQRELSCNPGSFNATTGLCKAGLMQWANLVSAPQHGTALAVNPDVRTSDWKQPPVCPAGQNCNGYILYTGNPDYNGPDSFTFQVSDGFTKDPTLYTATITVTPINDPPRGIPDTIQVWDAGHPTSVAVPDGPLSVDFDPEIAQEEGAQGICWSGPDMTPCGAPSQSIRFNGPTVTRPQHADSALSSWQPASDGAFQYLVNASYPCAQYPLAAGQNGQTPCLDTFVYQPCDDNSVTTRQASMPSPPTSAPTAVQDACDGDPAVVGPPVNLNSLALPAVTRLTTVTLDIRHYDLRALPDDLQGLEDNPLIVATQDGLMANDPGAPNATKLVLEDTPHQGSLSMFPDGSFTYTPFPNFCNAPSGKPDLFHYHLEDAKGARGNTVAAKIEVVCVDDPPAWNSNGTLYKVPMNYGSLSDRFWAMGTGTTTVEMLDPNWVNSCAWCGWAPGVIYVPRTNGVLPGPCTPPPPVGIVDECTTQTMKFVVQDDNPTLFADYGQPSVSLYHDAEFMHRPFADSQRPPAWANNFAPLYGWLNFTINKFSYGVAHLNVCLKDDGVETGSATGPGSIDTSCQLVTVIVPGPPMTHPDFYAAYSGRLMVQTNATGVLANDQNSTGVYYLGYHNPPDAAGVRHGTPITASLFSAPSHAVNFGLNPDGSFSYLPDPAFQGVDVFRYMAKDLHYRSIVPETVTITVSHNLPPGADFVWQPSQPIANQRVQFQDRSGVAGAAIVSWAWDFGDGSSVGCMDDSCRNVDHVYASQGLFSVRLSIVDRKGEVDQVTRLVNVAPAGPSTDARFTAPNYVPPVANAGHDFAVREGTAVELVGAAEPANAIAGYQWTQTGGPAVHLDNPSSATTRFTAPALGEASSMPLVFSLVASDGRAESAPSVVHVMVLSGNTPPVAHAGVVQAVTSGIDVVLDGSASADPDGDRLTYLWTQVDGPPVALADATQATAHFVAPVTLLPAELAFQLQVADGHGAPAYDRVVVMVRPVQVVAGFSFLVGGLAEPGRVAFTGGSAIATWDFGDGLTATGSDPVHTYAKSGTYQVTLAQGSKAYEAPVTVAFHATVASRLHQSPGLGVVVAIVFLVAVVWTRRR